MHRFISTITTGVYDRHAYAQLFTNQVEPVRLPAKRMYTAVFLSDFNLSSDHALNKETFSIYKKNKIGVKEAQ